MSVGARLGNKEIKDCHLELDFLCLKEIRIWKSPPMSTRANFITIAGFKICQANRVHYLDSLDFMV